MIPMFFGPSDSPLFGSLHEPESAARDHGVLLCPPVGQEHVRAHWAFRQVAISLSRAGFHCFRFDWFGVGDSAGDLASATLARWKEDVASAAQELRDVTGVRKVSLLGLRFGGTLATLAAGQIRPSCLVLWDPVPDGAGYLSELRHLHVELLSDPKRYFREGQRASRPAEIVGFDFGADLPAEIEGIHLDSLIHIPKARVCLIRSSSSPEFAEFSERLRNRKLEVEVHTTESDGRWSAASEIETLLLPADAVRTITDYLVRRAS
ncbi:MAG: alpha/beta fold hydrolase [Polyangiaceae bacterium]|nr:alpha/beta fold hydrolase [Polyangiaceae bacterium]